MSFEGIPIVDMGRSGAIEKNRLARTIREICHSIGFFYVKNHGIAPELCARYLDAARCFFDLPAQEKRRIHKENSPHFRGWEQLGSELTNNQIDHREQLDLGTERTALTDPHPHYMRLVGPNQWLEENVIPGFKGIVLDYMRRMETLSRHILSLLSISLDLKEDHIEKLFGAEPMPYCKLICYPATPNNRSGVGEHKDAGFLSIVLQDEVGGLQAQNGFDEWVDVPPVRGTFAVNLGEMLQVMTRNYYVATPHRVINRDTHRKRYSLGYFYNPDLNTRLHPLPIAEQFATAARASEHHARAGFMASRSHMMQGGPHTVASLDSDVYGDKYWDRWVRSYPEIVRKHYPDKTA